jgi:hypothetical protein
MSPGNPNPRRHYCCQEDFLERARAVRSHTRFVSMHIIMSNGKVAYISKSIARFA